MYELYCNGKIGVFNKNRGKNISSSYINFLVLLLRFKVESSGIWNIYYFKGNYNTMSCSNYKCHCDIYNKPHVYALPSIIQGQSPWSRGNARGCRPLVHNCLARFNTLRPRQNGHHFPDNIFKCIFLNEKVQISITISPKFVPNGLINNIPALVQIMAWRRPGDKPLSEPLVVILPPHICVTRPVRKFPKAHHFM